MGEPAHSTCDHAHLTLPVPTDQVRGPKATRDGPLPLPAEGGEGRSGNLRLHLLAAQRAARAFAGGLAFGPHRAAVDEDVLDAGGGGRRRLEGRAIGNGRRVEDGDVSIGAGGEHAAAGQPEAGGGQAGHAPHRFFEPEKS